MIITSTDPAHRTPHTTQLALHTNDTYSGLLNATFGNFSELILSLLAMHKRLYRVVQLSLLGSILSNLLLVLGCSCLLGGYRFRIQRFTTVSGGRVLNCRLLKCWTAVSRKIICDDCIVPSSSLIPSAPNGAINL